MLVKTEDLQEGCILSEDVFSKTNRPIIPKKTVLTNELIEFLNAFLIKEVRIEETLVSGIPFNPLKSAENHAENLLEDKEYKKTGFTDLFLKAVKEYKKEFRSWQAGSPVDISRIRSIVFPLIEKFESSPSEIFTLHHFSTEKEYLYQHPIATGLICGLIGKKSNYNKGDVLQLILAGCLSDCGMAKVPSYILTKKEPLTWEEYEEIKQHPAYSYKMVQDSSLIRDIGKISIFQHHERLDGSGYPLGIKNRQIHPFAKIIAVADTFHAATSERLYRKKQSPFKVLEMIYTESFGKFDVAAIKVLQSAIMNVSIGSNVMLSNGQIAEILFMEEKSPTRPLVKLIQSGEILPLEKHRDIFIEEVL